MHVYKELMQCKSVCNIGSVIDPLLFWLGHEQKMFLVSFDDYEMAGFVWRRKNGPNAFQTGAKIHFSEKGILGLEAL